MILIFLKKRKKIQTILDIRNIHISYRNIKIFNVSFTLYYTMFSKCET